MQNPPFIPQIRVGDTPDKKQVISEPKPLAIEKPVPTTNTMLIPKINPGVKDGISPKFNFSILKGFFNRSGKFRKILLGLLVFVIVIIVLVGIPMFIFYAKAQAFAKSASKLADAGKSQNIPLIKTELANTRKSLASLKGAYTLISWTKFVPFVGGYSRDLGHTLKAGEAGLEAGEIVIATVEPYADILGLEGTQTGDGAKTTQERIDFIIKTIPDLIPKIDKIAEKAKIVKTEVDMINPDRYPEKFRGKEVRSNIKKGIELVDSATYFLTQGKPILEAAPYLLGIESQRTYLLLFQNDKELRPTGGFMTAYAIMNVDKAKFEPVSSNDIYNLDAKYKPSVPAPDPIIKYLKGPYLISTNFRLRDMNWSPDFSESMKLVIEEAGTVGIEDIDGIIAVDTHLLVNLLNAIGPIGVPGFGNFGTQEEPLCKCPQVIYELESFADVEGPIVWDPAGTGKIIYAPPNYENRKKIVGPLMNSILANALGQPKEKLPALFQAVFTSVIEKHVLLYILDSKVQTAVNAFGMAGTIKDREEGSDYLHINDSNLGGRKSNLYVSQEVDQEISVSRDGTVEKTVTLTYKNPEKHDGWLNSVLPNWVRIYVPKGSELLAFEGVDDKADPYEDLGKTVFAGHFELRPQGVSKVTVKYKLPSKVKGDYKLFVQKQPGTDTPLYRLKLGKSEEESFLTSDKEFILRR